MVFLFESWSIDFEQNSLRISPYSVRMGENVGKMWTRITPNTDTLYEVIIVSNFHIPKAETRSHQYRVRANLTKESLFCTSSNPVKAIVIII